MLKRKINAVKTLKDKIFKLEDNPVTAEAILTNNTKFEIEIKENLKLITEFIVTNTTKKKQMYIHVQSNLQTRFSYRNLKLRNSVVTQFH